MLKEISGNELKDRTINPEQVLSIRLFEKNQDHSVIHMINGQSFVVVGSVTEITKKLNAEKRLLKG
jgi:uncharacterized protein YlzI (FlbEa/FlbD family)